MFSGFLIGEEEDESIWMPLLTHVSFPNRYLVPAQHGMRSTDTIDPIDLYPGYNLSVPVDHFHNDSRYAPHSHDTFNLRYFFDAQYYAPGGPVIVLQSGETSATDRLPFLQKGIVAQLARATHGIGVVLEHR